MSLGSDLTILVALAAGVISFLSPCVLPLVPAYVGQLTAIAVAAHEPGSKPSRWLAVRHALAFVGGFGAVFTVLGVTATFAAGPLYEYLAPLRIIGGAVLIVMGLSLAGLVPIAALDRIWRPLDAGASASLATTTGSVSLGGSASNGRSGGAVGVGDRLGRRLVGSRGGWFASFGLGAVFAVGWTPCIGIILGGILAMAISSGTTAQGTILLVAYTAGLGLPFIAIAAIYDRAPRLVAPLVRHGRVASLVGGILVAAIGVAMVFDWLALLPRYFNFVGI